MKRALIIVACLAVLLTLGVLATLPEVRLKYLGNRFTHGVQVQSKDRIAVMLSLEKGQEIRGEEPTGEDDDEVPYQEDHQAAFVMEETILESADGLIARYVLTELRSEQWDWTKGELGDASFEVRVFPGGLPSDIKVTGGSNSALLEDSVLLPLFSMLWPKLPGSYARVGKTAWSGQIPVHLRFPLLDNDDLVLQHTLAYRLESYRKSEQKILGAFEVHGALRSEHPNTEGKGQLKGVSLVDTQSGLTVGGEYRVEQKVDIKLEGLPEFRWAQIQGVRFWRVNKDDLSNPHEAKP